MDGLAWFLRDRKLRVRTPTIPAVLVGGMVPAGEAGSHHPVQGVAANSPGTRPIAAAHGVRRHPSR
nr:hypothetical protein OH837_03915 [Streptomyces canus]